MIKVDHDTIVTIMLCYKATTIRYTRLKGFIHYTAQPMLIIKYQVLFPKVSHIDKSI